jgi:Glycosyl hydrolases family 2/Glycoside hydrolase family 2 C-terminal domain 5/Glycosyl hydrolases family 2, TIM barrel domain/Glycosyl hydrolases family 2, sugar binding domain
MNDGQLQSARSRRAPRRLDLATLLVVLIAGASACGKSGTATPPAGAGGSSNPTGTAGNSGSAGMSGDASVSTGTGGALGGGGAPVVDASTAVDLATPPDASAPTDAMPVADASTTATRVDINFDVDWRYQRADVTGAEAKSFADTAWPFVDLPHTPKFVTPEDPFAYAGISWYRKHFTVPIAYQGAKVFVEVGAAMQLADVWVNDTHKIQHQGGYAPFTIDVTANVSYGGADNVIAIKLDSNPNAAFPPGRTGVDFQYNGGLYRHVTMHVTNALHVSDAVYANRVAGGGVFVTYPVATTASANVNITTNVINESTSSKSTTVVSRILDAGGALVGMASATSTVAAGASADFAQTVVIANPKLWHPNTPVLYTLRTTVQDGTTAVDDISTRIGIRRIQWSRAGGLVINGARFKALGINLLEETYGLGNAISDQSIFYDVKRVREAGLTFIRGSHYLHAPAFYDACDALGVMVMDAQTGWQNFSAATAFVNNTYQELRDMIRRDRNHPSVVAWEANLNESSFTDAWALAAHNIVHAEYPNDQAFSAQWLFTHADIFIDASQHNVRASTDTRPIIINEYGDWDYGGVTSTTRQAREAGDAAMLIQTNNVQDGQGKNMVLPWFSADGYWDYADYGGYAGITRAGLLDMYRLPKFAYYFLQSQRDPAVTVTGVDSGPMVFIANQWTATSPTTVRVFSNCDQVSLSLNGTLVATRSPDTGTGLLHPPFNFAVGSFTAGTLRADCLIGGTTRVTTTRQTPTDATALRLRPEGPTLRADLGDARLVFIDITDANGTVVPTDNRQVTLAVSGPASIVGPTTLTMKGGQLAVWIRPGRVAGPITVTASAAGLTAGTATLTAQAVPDLPPAPAGRP